MMVLGSGRRLRVGGVLRMALIALVARGAAQAQTGSAAESEQVDAILTRLERRNDGLRDIRCEVRLDEEDKINLSKRTKTGKAVLRFGDPNPMFMIHFERTETDGVLGKEEWYLFDGRWLMEGSERLQQVTQTEFARPGERVDFFDLETAPFPMPFGQKKETILRNFDVVLAAAAPGDPPETDHLVCTPKTDSRFRGKYDRMEFFVRRGLDLPTRISITKNKGLETTVADFPGLDTSSINAGVKDDAFAQPAAWKKFKFVVEGTGPSVERKPESP